MEFNIEERVEKAKRLFKEGGYNCCQAVVLAYNDLLGLDDETAAAISSGFGGGMGRMREVCGSFSGMAMLAGFISPADDPSIKEARTANYALVQEFAEGFRNVNGGSIVCREILKNPPSDPNPSPRTAEYYAKRPCAKMVLTAGRLLDEFIADHPMEEGHG